MAFFNYKIFPFRCFAESSLNMETYDAVVEYEQLGWARKKAYQFVLILNNLFLYFTWDAMLATWGTPSF